MTKRDCEQCGRKESCNNSCTYILNIYIEPYNKKDLNLNKKLKLYDDMIGKYPKIDTVKIIFNFPKEQEAVQCSGNFIDRNEFIEYLTDMFDMLKST